MRRNWHRKPNNARTTTNKTHIETQETHIPHGHNYKYNGYRTITEAAAPTKEMRNIKRRTTRSWGSNINRWGSRTPHLKHTKNRDRLLRITLRSTTSNTPLKILNTYAPRKGYSKQNTKNDRKVPMPQSKPYLPQQHMTIWRDDTNGQLGDVKGAGGNKPKNTTT